MAKVYPYFMGLVETNLRRKIDFRYQVGPGVSPMYTLYKKPEIEKFFVDFYQTGKPTAAICHGTSILLNTKLPNGKFLVDGKKWTGFAS